MRATPSSAGCPQFLPFSLLPFHCLSSLSHIFPSLPFPLFSDERSSFQNGNGRKDPEEPEIAPQQGWRNVHSTATNQLYFHLLVGKQMFDNQTHCEQIHRSSPVLTQLWSHSLCFWQVGCYSSQSFESERQNYAFKDLLGAIMI